MRTPLQAKPISGAIGRSVRRYSRAVAWMKVLLPLGAVAVIAVLFLSAQKQGDLADIFTAEELITLGAGLRLDNPRFAGVTDQGEPFAIRADWALPDSAMPRLIDLERPKGEIEMNDGRTIAVSAASGQMRREQKILVLEGEVVLDTSDGYRVETELIEIDLAANTAKGPGPVTGTGPLGEIQAGSFRADAGKGGERNGQIWFENRVRLVFIPDTGGD
jgi:lipopolysaccharide export system protein LptC